MGKWNGFGGKVEAGETIPAAAMVPAFRSLPRMRLETHPIVVTHTQQRELQEEAGITALDLVKRGCVAFTFEDSPVPMEVHVFKATKYSGVITESEEMRPQWFPVTEVPFASMWKDDEIWCVIWDNLSPLLEPFCFRDLRIPFFSLFLWPSNVLGSHTCSRTSASRAVATSRIPSRCWSMPYASSPQKSYRDAMQQGKSSSLLRVRGTHGTKKAHAYTGLRPQLEHTEIQRQMTTEEWTGDAKSWSGKREGMLRIPTLPGLLFRAAELAGQRALRRRLPFPHLHQRIV